MIQSQRKPTGKKTKKKRRTKTTRRSVPALPHHPYVKPDAVDVVGIVPGDVYIDPELTEGHTGYEESGDSEISQLL